MMSVSSQAAGPAISLCSAQGLAAVSRIHVQGALAHSKELLAATCHSLPVRQALTPHAAPADVQHHTSWHQPADAVSASGW